MLVDNQLIKVTWNPKVRTHYEKLGYKFTKYNDDFVVNVQDLLSNSSKMVKVVCDYCNKEFETSYQHYCRSILKHPKIACQNCSGIKISEYSLEKRQNKIFKNLRKICDDKGYLLLSKKEDIKNLESAIKFQCPMHGVQTKKAKHLLGNKACGHCANETRKKRALNIGINLCRKGK